MFPEASTITLIDPKLALSAVEGWSPIIKFNTPFFRIAIL
jgi:hypothetical protein